MRNYRRYVKINPALSLALCRLTGPVHMSNVRHLSLRILERRRWAQLSLLRTNTFSSIKQIKVEAEHIYPGSATQTSAILFEETQLHLLCIKIWTGLEDAISPWYAQESSLAMRLQSACAATVQTGNLTDNTERIFKVFQRTHQDAALVSG